MLELNATTSFIGVLTLLITMLGWLLRGSLADLRALEKELSNLRLQLVSEYTKEAKFESKIDALFRKLDEISAKLDAKQDKQDCVSCTNFGGK